MFLFHLAYDIEELMSMFQNIREKQNKIETSNFCLLHSSSSGISLSTIDRSCVAFHSLPRVVNVKLIVYLDNKTLEVFFVCLNKTKLCN